MLLIMRLIHKKWMRARHIFHRIIFDFFNLFLIPESVCSVLVKQIFSLAIAEAHDSLEIGTLYCILSFSSNSSLNKA